MSRGASLRGGRLVDPVVVAELQYELNELLYDLPPEPGRHDEFDMPWKHQLVGCWRRSGR